MSSSVAYLAPFVAPAVGGAARYVRLLGEGLLRQGLCDSFRVVTEAHPRAAEAEPAVDGFEVVRIYPFRAGADRRGWQAFVRYGVQNLQFLALPRALGNVDTLFVHGSFLNHPSTLPAALRLVRLRHPALRMVLDLRDPKFPPGVARTARRFDAVVSSSMNISQRLGPLDDVWEIPVMIDPLPVDAPDAADAARAAGLTPGGYVFNGSGFYEAKGTPRLLEVVAEIRRRGRDVTLAVAGKRRHWGPRFEQAASEGWLHALGELPPTTVRRLSVASWIDVNLSSVDSVPRHSLEAMQSGAATFLPPGVPEFAALDEITARPNEDVASLATRIAAAADAGDRPRRAYDLGRHEPTRVVAQYGAMLAELAKTRG